MLRQKTVDILSQFPPDSFRSGDFLHGRFPEPIYRTKFSEKQILAVLTYSRAIIEDAFTDAFFHQQLVVGVREAVSFVANSLE